jgi:hypothetical protein
MLGDLLIILVAVKRRLCYKTLRLSSLQSLEMSTRTGVPAVGVAKSPAQLERTITQQIAAWWGDAFPMPEYPCCFSDCREDGKRCT